MKSIEEIEKMNLEELERIADDTGVPVPEDLKAGLDGVIDSLELVDRAVERHERRRIIYGICTAAVCLQVFIFAGLMHIRGRNAPVDTFDDPELAYAMVQEVLGQVGLNMRKGVAAVDRSREMADRSFETMEEIIRKK